MNQPSVPEQSPNTAAQPQSSPPLNGGNDDIPEALRDAPVPTTKSPPSRPVRWGLWLGAGGAIALVAGALVGWQFRNLETLITGSSAPPAAAEPGLSSILDTQDAIADPAAADPDADATSSLLGHRAYAEAPPETLVPLTADGRIRLRAAAAEQFQAMQRAAQAANISLTPLSGFRTIEEQKYLFFDVKAQRGQVARQRATVSAPPGYSEHHTGYAIDIGDGSRPDTNLQTSFEQTAAFQWLEANAAFYSFELSFEGGENSQVSYEPWHWRFVGDPESLELFYGSGSRPAAATTVDGETAGSENGQSGLP
ncbi:MAG: M15 family metallopeptidase [Synechococcales bacterium]|nr:M15 family metallopeptidase [Synechococcales bacterium]